MIDDIGRPGRPMADYARTIRKGWWIVVATVLVVAAATYAFSSRQQPKFQATADDLIVAPTFDPSQKLSSSSITQYVNTQASIAQSPQVAGAALALVPQIKDMTPGKLLTASTITADPVATVVSFSVSYDTRAGAVALTNAYARAFATYTHDEIRRRARTGSRSLNSRSTISAHRSMTRSSRSRRTSRSATRPATTSSTRALTRKQQQAELNLTELKASTQNNLGQSRVQSQASGAAQLAPNTKRNTAVGIILGFVLGIGLIFAREAFDTRVRSAEQVSSELGLPLFGRLPRPDKDMRRHDQLTLLADPHGIHSEAYKKLRVSLEFANLDPQAQMILVTSAVAQEGKSTTAANLAVAMAASGKNVILVDLDLRAPYLDRFFGSTRRPGVTDVVLGNATLDEALVPASSPALPIRAHAGTATATRRRDRCSTCWSQASRRPTPLHCLPRRRLRRCSPSSATARRRS